ncbi:Scr1 family TA system antitoxin-like transcriptional regulator [Plantactinospora solaniradicis]|uniref:Scr1 family TA system antitoxin-like transcriptional regulator n=1 Tax=Plantactinospora solaniradicis TaxID=1723736 RepID=A0ABW1KAF0_9ACTN
MNQLREILRAQRGKRRLTQEQAGAAINVSGSLIAAFENGRAIPQPETAAQLDSLFGTGEEVQQAADEAREDARPSWLRPWTEHEQRATLLRWWEPLLMPGLLQLEEYARAVLQGGWLEDEVVERTVQVRHDRQAATVNRPKPPTLSAIISEFALMCAPPQVRREQLEHLLELSRRPKVQVLVVPRSAGLHAGLQGAFVLATLPGRGRAGYVDDQLRGRVVTDGSDLDQLEVSWEIVTGLALPVQASRDLIAKVVNDSE